jgi:hypothetical protein
MHKVLGIGGLFFRSKDPAALAKWYEDNLGVKVVPSTYEESPWVQESGPTVFAPFASDTSRIRPFLSAPADNYPIRIK